MPGLYLHIPFCEHKCIYCDFYSLAPDEERMDERGMMEEFTGNLVREIVLRSEVAETSPAFDTVFFGGGTPSLLGTDQMRTILQALHERFPMTPDAEVTLEANPGTVSGEKLAAFRAMGFNRVSFGVQSFHDDELRLLTRIHSAEQAERSVREARRAGFENLNIDLIFSLPGQTPERWEQTLRRAVALAPDHLSCYSLTVEPNTPLARMVASQQVRMLDRDIDADIYQLTGHILVEEGYRQYEVSNFARPGRECRHNLTYWRHGEYLGFGPSAHSFWGGTRRWNIANLSTYSDALRSGTLPVAGEEALSREQRMTEQVFLGLRSDGLDLDRFEGEFGTAFADQHRETIGRLTADGLASLDGRRLVLTPRGYMMCDEICASLV